MQYIKTDIGGKRPLSVRIIIQWRACVTGTLEEPWVGAVKNQEGRWSNFWSWTTEINVVFLIFDMKMYAYIHSYKAHHSLFCNVSLHPPFVETSCWCYIHTCTTNNQWVEQKRTYTRCSPNSAIKCPRCSIVILPHMNPRILFVVVQLTVTI